MTTSATDVASVTAPDHGPLAAVRDRARRRGLAAALVALAALLTGLALVGVAAPTDAAPRAATGGCRQVGGGAVASPGPKRATVVVDVGGGDVWAACISFSGTISGIDALELAAAQIPDLDPVYDIYPGVGRAVCQLRGTGNEPPDCLGKSVDYWAYFRNGAYSRGGAGATTVADGDVEGWRWGRSSTAAPGAPTTGYVATAAAPPVTTTTTRPSTPTTTAGGGFGGRPGQTTTTAPGTPIATTVPGATTTTVPGAATTIAPGGTTTTEVGDPAASTTTTAEGTDGVGSGPAADDDDGSAAALPAVPTGDDGGSGSSSAGSIVGFALALALVVGLGLVLRRRRAASTSVAAAT